MGEDFDQAAVLDEVARGNLDAFRKVVRAHSLSLRSFISSQVYDLDQADDLTQEVFIAAFRSLDTFRRREDLGRWLRGIARLKLQMHFRSSARRRNAMERFREDVSVLTEADLEHASAACDSVNIEALLRCVARLPDKMRRVVHAGLDGTKPTLLADSLATSVGAVYNLHYRANQLLRDCVKKELAHGA